MKHKVLALVLALTVASWAQTATQNAPAPQDTPSKCACCEKMASADAKEGHACMHHDMKSSDGKEMGSCCAGKDKDKAAMSCCGDKDAKSCMKGDKDQSAKSCCAEKGEKMSGCCSDKCSKDDKSCCSENKAEKTAANCCAGHMRS